MKYSIIFIVDEESEEFAQLFDMICGLFEEKTVEFEIFVVANGTETFVQSQLDLFGNYSDKLKVISFQRIVPQPVCLNVALDECSGAGIFTLGPFQELTPESYEKLLHSVADEVDLVVPFRRNRKDPIINRLHSKLLNMVMKKVIGTKINDIGCNVRFFRREVLESIDLYGNMYRYFPALAAQKGFKVKEVDCEQAEKIRKSSFYSARLYLDRAIEILNLFFSTHYSKKPLRFFSFVGSSFMALGVLALIYVGFQKVVYDVPIGTRPLLMVAMISLVGGTQIASFGLLGEIISFVHGRSRKEYTIEKII